MRDLDKFEFVARTLQRPKQAVDAVTGQSKNAVNAPFRESVDEMIGDFIFLCFWHRSRRRRWAFRDDSVRTVQAIRWKNPEVTESVCLRSRHIRCCQSRNGQSSSSKPPSRKSKSGRPDYSWL